MMGSAGFLQEGQPGAWVKTMRIGAEDVRIPVDLMVPEGFAPPGGRRGVRIPPHDKMAARKAVGLEGAVLDNDLEDVGALNASDGRRYSVRIAGPAALMVAKVHKLRDRLSESNADRIADKDAADVYRLMLATPVTTFLYRLRPLLLDDIAGPPSRDGVELLRHLFGTRSGDGVRMAANALRVALPSERVADVCTGFVRQVAQGLEGG
jgi:hypothetical protein